MVNWQAHRNAEKTLYLLSRHIWPHLCWSFVSALRSTSELPLLYLVYLGTTFPVTWLPCTISQWRLERFKVGGGRKLRCLSFPLPAQGGILGSAISPGSLQFHPANLSSVLSASSLCRAPSSASSPSSGSLCGPSGLRVGATSSHCHPLGCCTLSSLASQFYHHLGNNTSFLY